MKKIIVIAATVILGPPAYSQTSTNAALVSYPTSENPSANPAPVPTTSTVAMAGRFGAGVTFGEPIGATVKYFFTDTIAIDGAIGWSSADHADLYLQSDVLWHNYDLLKVSRGALPVYFGVGPLLRFRSGGDDNQVGIRAPVGLSYFFDKMPIEIFGEIAPALDVSPSVRGEVTGGIGIRYWF